MSKIIRFKNYRVATKAHMCVIVGDYVSFRRPGLVQQAIILQQDKFLMILFEIYRAWNQEY